MSLFSGLEEELAMDFDGVTSFSLHQVEKPRETNRSANREINGLTWNKMPLCGLYKKKYGFD